MKTTDKGALLGTLFNTHFYIAEWQDAYTTLESKFSKAVRAKITESVQNQRANCSLDSYYTILENAWLSLKNDPLITDDSYASGLYEQMAKHLKQRGPLEKTLSRTQREIYIAACSESGTNAESVMTAVNSYVGDTARLAHSIPKLPRTDNVSGSTSPCQDLYDRFVAIKSLQLDSLQPKCESIRQIVEDWNMDPALRGWADKSADTRQAAALC